MFDMILFFGMFLIMCAFAAFVAAIFFRVVFFMFDLVFSWKL